MQRILSAPRKNWKQQAQSLGFKFHTIEGEKYWDESAYYRFSLKQIENDLEAPTEEIHQMCLQLVDKAVRSDEIMNLLRIPEQYWDYVQQSWANSEPHLYGTHGFCL